MCMKRQPSFLEAISTIIVMVIVVTLGFIKFNIPIQVLLISSAYAALIAWSRLKMERFRRGDHSKINDSYACNIYYTSCRYNSWELDVFWNCSSFNILRSKVFKSTLLLVSAF